jgi:phage-related protein/predicted XRE-type DNA-binding protein
MMKEAVFLGDSRVVIRSFPYEVRREAGFQIDLVQSGQDPEDWKPLKAVGPGVREIRIRDETGAYRIVYIANIADAVYVLHAFQKKTEATAKRDLEVAAARDPERTYDMKIERFASVWDALEDSPAEAASMKARSHLLMAVQETIKSWQVTQAQAAKRLKITQPRLNDLLRGKINKFSMDALIDLATHAGLSVNVKVRKQAA